MDRTAAVVPEEDFFVLSSLPPGRAQKRPGTDLRAWLFAILHNQHCNEVRRSVREGSSVGLDQAPPVPVLSNAIAVLELRDLERAINRLPEDQRTVVLLIGLEGMLT
jgi:RNA polymerase sigma-70 factor (ECF subfamily)